MNKKSLLIALGFTYLAYAVFGQGSFGNLNFDQGKMVFFHQNPPVVYPTEALPAWTAHTYGETPSALWYNEIGIGSTMVSIHDQYSPYIPVLQGKYTLFFQRQVPNGEPIPFISQTAPLPDGAYSLQYKTRGQSSSKFGPDSFDVTYNGQLLPRKLLETTDAYKLWAVDLMPVLGQYGELRFAGWGALDALRFSALQIPEPGTLSLVLSALVACLLRRGSALMTGSVGTVKCPSCTNGFEWYDGEFPRH